MGTWSATAEDREENTVCTIDRICVCISASRRNRSCQVPKASIDKALKDAKGEKGDMDVEFLWEVRGPGRAAVLIEILCKNRSMIQVWHLG